MMADWKPVATLAELPAGGRKLVRLDGHNLLLFNVAGAVHAIADSCPHAGAWLGSGKLDGCWLRCPAHGMMFDVRTGRMRGADGLALRVYPGSVGGRSGVGGPGTRAVATRAGFGAPSRRQSVLKR
jgi:3-phenylpropionate/trans-cinnamate dioxygenase ferredoxin subunit